MDSSQAGSSNSSGGIVLNIPFQHDTVSSCEGVVDEYEQRKISKLVALAEIVKLFSISRHEIPELQAAKGDGLLAFLRRLDYIESDRKQKDSKDALPSSSKALQLKGRKRIMGDGSDEERGNEPAKKKLNLSMLPSPGEYRDHKSLSPQLQRTLDLKIRYSRNLPGAIHDVLLHPHRPVIPEHLWADILSCRFVNLDEILTDIYYPEPVGPNFGLMKRVKSSSDWVIAWVLYQEAVLVAFPHRLDELRNHYEQIYRLFDALEHHPELVINYDKALRTQVTFANDKLLTDTSLFYRNYTTHIIGPLFTLQASSSGNSCNCRSRQAKSSQPCRRYNRGVCPGNCRYPHVCSSCGSQLHSSMNCQENS